MAQITVRFADAIAPRVVAGLCAKGGYEEDDEITPADFAHRVVLAFIGECVREHESRLAADAAIAAASEKARREIIVT